LGGGVQFEGFTDAGASISSVEINSTSTTNPAGDFVGLDDLRFVTSGSTVISDPPAVPECSTWAMMLVGFAGLGYAARLRGRKARVGSAIA
jgi:hypothetical protein